MVCLNKDDRFECWIDRVDKSILSDSINSLSLSLLQPLWARNVPKFGIAHAMALGLGPWLAVEIPDLIQRGVVVHVENQEGGGGGGGGEKAATN